LEPGAPALGDPRRDEGSVRAARQCRSGADLGEGRARVRPGPGDGAEHGTVPRPGVAVEGPEVGDDSGPEWVQVEVAAD